MSPKRAATDGAAPPSASRATVSGGATIFIVDEDDAVRDALTTSLRAAGHPVAAFSSGRQFLEACQVGQPGCLVVDMDLSDLGAAELLRTLAAARVALPAIITSRRLQRRIPVGGLPPGPTRFLDKPFGIDELLRVIRIALAEASGNQPGS